MNREYVVQSLELHLFFARIMKEHAFFLKVGFLPPQAAMAQEADCLLRKLEGVLGRAISLSDCVVRPCVLDSGEIVTEFTDRAECQTGRLTGTEPDRTLTECARKLRGSDGEPEVTRALVCQVRALNREALQLVNELIALKERTLRGVDCCRMTTGNYLLLIEHILREARCYRASLMRLEGMRGFHRRDLCDGTSFWNRIMMEHALFIRGLLDPGEEALIGAADGFAADYRRLLETASAANDRTMGEALELTKKVRDFKRAGVEGIEACRIRSLILPLLADHVLREANHYLRLLC